MPAHKKTAAARKPAVKKVTKTTKTTVEDLGASTPPPDAPVVEAVLAPEPPVQVLGEAVATAMETVEKKPSTERLPATPSAKMERRVMRRVRQGLAAGLTQDEVLAVIDGLRAKIVAEKVE
jgi:hypothetical protein